MKKVLSIFLAVVILISGVVFASAKGNDKLQFDENGQFKILVLADIQSGFPVGEALKAYITEAIDASNPDLVMFLGDNIMSPEDGTVESYWKGYDEVFPILESKGVPFTFVFGNHDAEAEPTCPCLAKENQISVYCEYDNFRGTMNDEDVYGCGNYNLPILSSDGKRVAWNVWCIDSNDYVRDENYNVIKDEGYGFVHDDQIAWYEKKAAELKAENGGKAVPSLLFQHIPVLQEYNKLTEVSECTPGAVERNGKFYIAEDGAILDGSLGEGPCPPEKMGSQFESWKKTGDIVAAFFGHDHKNTFTMDVDGIKLVQTHGAGYYTYGCQRGGRLIVIDENKPDTYESELLFVDRITDGEI